MHQNIYDPQVLLAVGQGFFNLPIFFEYQRYTKLTIE